MLRIIDSKTTCGDVEVRVFCTQVLISQEDLIKDSFVAVELNIHAVNNLIKALQEVRDNYNKGRKQ